MRTDVDKPLERNVLLPVKWLMGAFSVLDEERTNAEMSSWPFKSGPLSDAEIRNPDLDD
jgi:hypothetical protein